MSRKSRMSKERRQRDAAQDRIPLDTFATPLRVPSFAPEADAAALSQSFQDHLRRSPLWEQMVRQFGEEKAAQLLQQFNVRLDPL
jgi:hypothetical protein